MPRFDQRRLIEQSNKYLHLQGRAEIENKKGEHFDYGFNKGVCNGYAYLMIIVAFLDQLDQWEAILSKVSTWEPEEDSDIDECTSWEFEYFLQLCLWLHGFEGHEDCFKNPSWEQSNFIALANMVIPLGVKSLEKKFSIVYPFMRNEFIDCLQRIAVRNAIVVIGDIGEDGFGHRVSLVKKGESYFFHEPNDAEGIMSYGSIDEMLEDQSRKENTLFNQHLFGTIPLHVLVSSNDDSISLLTGEMLIEEYDDARDVEADSILAVLLSVQAGDIAMTRHWTTWMDVPEKLGMSHDPEGKGRLEYTMNAITRAAELDYFDIVLRLLKRGMNPDGLAGSIYSPLVRASAHVSETAILLLDNGANPSYLDKATSLSALHTASEAGNLSLMRRLLDDARVDIEHKNKHGHTALAVAVKSGQIDAVKLLLERGANPNVISCRGFTLLMAAVAVNSEQLIWLLISFGAANTAQRNAEHYSLLDILVAKDMGQLINNLLSVLWFSDTDIEIAARGAVELGRGDIFTNASECCAQIKAEPKNASLGAVGAFFQTSVEQEGSPECKNEAESQPKSTSASRSEARQQM